MKFIFNGRLDELKETIRLKAKEYNKNIVIYDNEPNILEIGFQRLGHSSGRFFIANVTEESDKVILDGEIKNVFPNQKKSKGGRIWSEFTEYLLAYIFLEILLIIPWLFLRNVISLWMPLILPIIYLIIRHFLNKKYDEKLDKEFAEFMSFCTAYTTDEHNWYDVYKKLDLAQGKLQTICDDDQDMLLITYEDGMQIDVGYIEEDKTYYITVVKDDTMESWNNPLGEFATTDKSKLPTELQKAIRKFRNIQL
ncbi:MAG: hypothetical protein U0L55_04465 [Acutalibacteraceae bacterium]|nr:hypothetical protein [Acutalibacteraceae bacterium]